MNARAQALRAHLGNRNLLAFLAVIRSGEGTSDDAGYQRLFGGGLVNDLSDHPRRKVTRKLGGKPITSSAAGAYQFLAGTWDECVAALALPDFSRASQDVAAVFLIQRRRGLDAALAGRLEDAISACAREWASLPGSPYGQPVKTLAHCRATYEAAGGAYAPQVAPTPAAPQPGPVATAGEPPMPVPIPLLIGLASSLIDVFAPLAREKVAKEIARHTDKPEVAGQVATAIVEAAKAATGLQDPIEAVAAAKKDPDAVAQVQTDALDELARLGPVLERLAALDREAFAAGESSREAAHRRALGDPGDQDPYLTRAIVRMVVGILIGGAVLTAVLAYMKVDVQVVLGALLALVGAVGGKFQTRFDHRYGSSMGSSSKDILIERMSERPRP